MFMKEANLEKSLKEFPLHSEGRSSEEIERLDNEAILAWNQIYKKFGLTYDDSPGNYSRPLPENSYLKKI